MTRPVRIIRANKTTRPIDLLAWRRTPDDPGIRLEVGNRKSWIKALEKANRKILTGQTIPKNRESIPPRNGPIGNTLWTWPNINAIIAALF
jgi:hypothetical protein